MKTNITFLFIVISHLIFSQGASISGKILSSSDSSTAISGAFIELSGSFKRVMTNSNGEFVLNNLSASDYSLSIIHPNYRTIKISQTVLATSSINLIFYMTETVMDLPETTVSHSSMTGGEKGIKELPGSAYYLSPKELQKFNYTDINRVLRAIPGVNLQEEDGFGLRPNIGLRGSGVERSSKITIMEDGILMAPAPYSASSAYFFPTIGRMQSVEILKGSSQIKYGPYTTGGAINMISTQIPEQLAARVAINAGSFGYRNIHAFAGNSHEYFGYSIETFQNSADGFKILDNGGNTGFNKADYLMKFRLNTKKTAKIYQALSFKVGETNEVSNETYLGLTKVDFDNTPYRRYAASQMDQMNAKQRQLSATYMIRPAKFITITTTAYRNDFHRSWYKLDAVKDSLGNKKSIASILETPGDFNDSYDIITGKSSVLSDALYVKGNNRDYYSQGIQTVVGLEFKTGYVAHQIDLGFRYHQDEQDRFQLEDQYKMTDGTMFLTKAGEEGRESNRINFAIAAASHIQYKLKFKRITITTGLRHEHIILSEKDYKKNDPTRIGFEMVSQRNEVNVFIPGLSFDYKFNTKLAAFAGMHKGFAPPGVTEKSKPEESINYEAGLKFYTKGFTSQIVGFYTNYSNLLGTDMAASGGLGTGEMFNGGKAQSQGIEFQGIYDVTHHFKSSFNLPLTISYTYTDAFFKSSFASTFEDWGGVEDGDRLPYLSNHQLSANLSLEHSRFSVNIGGKYNSAMRSVAGQGDIPLNELVPSYFVLDASARYYLNKNVSFFVSATNLMNSVYAVAIRPAGYRPGMPRSFQIGLRANL